MFAAGLGWRDGSPAAPSYDQGTEQERSRPSSSDAAGIDINAATNAGETALHAAVNGRGAEHRPVPGRARRRPNAEQAGPTPLAAAMASRRELGDIVAFLKQKLNPLRPNSHLESRAQACV